MRFLSSKPWLCRAKNCCQRRVNSMDILIQDHSKLFIFNFTLYLASVDTIFGFVVIMNLQCWLSLQFRNNIIGCLDKFYQNTASTNWKILVTFWVNKNNVVPCSSYSNSTWSKPHSIRSHPFHSTFQVINPEADVIQWRLMDLRMSRNEQEIV